MLIAIGAGLRLLWWWQNYPTLRLADLGEAHNAALSFARTGIIGDTFHVGQGASAHLLPLPSIIAGTVFRLFGLDSPASLHILMIWSLTLVFSSYFLMFKVFGELGSPLRARQAAFGVLCIVPLNFALETYWFGYWEGGLAAALSAGLLLLIIRLDQRENLGWSAVWVTALLTALVSFVSPAIGLAGYACGLMLMVRRLPKRRWVGAIAVVIVSFLVVFGPWTYRNYTTFGTPILLRDNLGLEMAQANYPGAATAADRQREALRRHNEIHPWARPENYAKMVTAGGEIAYSAKLGAETNRWIAEHPAEFLRLCGRHLVEFVFPPTWYWSQFGGSGEGVGRKIILHWAISLLGFLGVFYSALRLNDRYRYAIIMVVLPILPYIIVQPLRRYRYVFFTLLVYFACDFISRLINWTFTARRGVAQ